MTKDELKVIVEEEMKTAEDLMSSAGEFKTMFMHNFTSIEGENLKSGVCFGDSGSMEKRFEIVEAVGCIMGVLESNEMIKSCDLICLISEAWVSQYDKDVDLKNVPSPRNDPKKKEVLIAAAQTFDKIGYLKMKQISSMEVKGKRFFTLTEMPEYKEASEFSSQDSKLFDSFWSGYKRGRENKDPIAKLPDFIKNAGLKEVMGNMISKAVQEISKTTRAVVIN